MNEFDIYMHSLRQANYVRPSREEELRLAAAKDAGDKEAADKLTQSCLPLVVNIARRWFKNEYGVRPLDIVQEGNLGLLIAVKKFDPVKFQTRLTTYATWWIRQRILRLMQLSKGGVIHLPCDIADGRREVPDRLIADDIEHLRTKGMLSLDYATVVMAHGECGTLGEMLPDTREPTVEERDDAEERQYYADRLHELISLLDPREQSIIQMRMQEHTLEAIGDAHGITREGVRQLELRILSYLRSLNETHPWNSNVKETAMSRVTTQSGNGYVTPNPPATKQDPFEVLESLTLPQVQAEISANDSRLRTARALHKKRAAYLKKLAAIVAAREGVSLTTGPPRMKVGEKVTEYLRKKPQQTVEQITAATQLQLKQVAACMRMSAKYKKDKANRWSLK